MFPTLQQNQSPLTIVPQFLDCLAKNGLLSTAFDELSTLQGEALTEDLESGHDKLKKKFAEITKLDITLNNFLVRARLKFSEGSCEIPFY